MQKMSELPERAELHRIASVQHKGRGIAEETTSVDVVLCSLARMHLVQASMTGGFVDDGLASREFVVSQIASGQLRRQRIVQRSSVQRRAA